MLCSRFLRNRRGVKLDIRERLLIDEAISEVRIFDARRTIVREGQLLDASMFLIEGFMSRHIDDRKGHRQAVAIQIPGDFVDLHGYPLKALDHDVGTLTMVKVGMVPHTTLDRLTRDAPELGRKLWYSTLLDAAMHRNWLFRVGRLGSIARVAHFLCEIDLRLQAAGLSDGRRFHLPITQADIGEMCGLTSEHVNRVLRKLREDGLVAARSGRFEIGRPVALAHLGEFDPQYLYVEIQDKSMEAGDEPIT